MENIYLSLVLSPLVGAVIVGLFGTYLGRTLSHWIAIIGVAVSTVLAFYVFNHHVIESQAIFNGNIYHWISIGDVAFSVGFLVDNLSALMLVVVAFISLMVHIYTIGYMADDKGYTRFFSYISLFTFAMFMLVISNNFMQLFFGWEAVGLMSYLLIGFWFEKESAVQANLKAFLVNRVGDFGFILGIALVFLYFGSLDYTQVFSGTSKVVEQDIFGVSVLTLICLLLFMGAMAKSAQVPLHVWLPESMEGPTPISALIHAATMVTAGIFMVARMSPLYELSEVALVVMMLIGAITAFFMGLLGIVQNDIKRIVAYSTLSQLGYMTVALGVSAYSVAIFHLMTHAFFKALLFLAAGSVIIAMHHEQNIQKMGGLYQKMPITYAVSIIGTLALIGFPGFSGFYSKDLIIEAVAFSNLPYASFAYWAVLLGVVITAFYSFRLLFLVFHSQPKMDKETAAHIKESPAVIVIPLILLAIPSVVIGFYTVEWLLFGRANLPAVLANSIMVDDAHPAMATLAQMFHSPLALLYHSVQTPTFWLMILGIFLAWFFVLKRPDLAQLIDKKFPAVGKVLRAKYGFDYFNFKVFATGSRGIGRLLWQVSEKRLIDGLVVNGSAKLVGYLARRIQFMQTGYLFHYVFFMIIALLLFLLWMLFISKQPLIFAGIF